MVQMENFNFIVNLLLIISKPRELVSLDNFSLQYTGITPVTLTSKIDSL